MFNFLFSICSGYYVNSSNSVYLFLIISVAETAKISPLKLIERLSSNEEMWCMCFHTGGEGINSNSAFWEANTNIEKKFYADLSEAVREHPCAVWHSLCSYVCIAVVMDYWVTRGKTVLLVYDIFISTCKPKPKGKYTGVNFLRPT